MTPDLVFSALLFGSYVLVFKTNRRRVCRVRDKIIRKRSARGGFWRLSGFVGFIDEQVFAIGGGGSQFIAAVIEGIIRNVLLPILALRSFAG